MVLGWFMLRAFLKIVHKITLGLAVVGLSALVFVWQGPVQARAPQPLYQQPVKLDPSGRPMYNYWEIQENRRHDNIRQSGGSAPTNSGPIQINPTDGAIPDPSSGPRAPVPMPSSPTQDVPMPEINYLGF